ncbi:MAG TPA: hypothetical protein ENI59_01545 [Euryarchaeota archaeon]|nr:hypothetical protein [Euryarchaeota archaeon]
MYQFQRRFGWSESKTIQDIFREGIKEGRSGSSILSELRSLGLGYRQSEFYEDWRRAQAIEQSKTWEARAKAESWYENVFEEFRKEKGLTSREMTDLLRERERLEEEGLPYTDLIEEFTEEEEEWRTEFYAEGVIAHG